MDSSAAADYRPRVQARLWPAGGGPTLTRPASGGAAGIGDLGLTSNASGAGGYRDDRGGQPLCLRELQRMIEVQGERQAVASSGERNARERPGPEDPTSRSSVRPPVGPSHLTPRRTARQAAARVASCADRCRRSSRCRSSGSTHGPAPASAAEGGTGRARSLPDRPSSPSIRAGRHRRTTPQAQGAVGNRRQWRWAPCGQTAGGLAARPP
jgi:hypothetical protein